MSALTDYLEFRAMACPDICSGNRESKNLEAESPPPMAPAPKEASSFFATAWDVIKDVLTPRQMCFCQDGPKSPYDHISVKGLLG